MKGFQPQHFTVLVTLVQRFKLIDEGHGAVALEAFVPGSGCEKKPFFKKKTFYQFQKEYLKEKLMVHGKYIYSYFQ